jgi:hypothetical protein
VDQGITDFKVRGNHRLLPSVVRLFLLSLFSKNLLRVSFLSGVMIVVVIA